MSISNHTLRINTLESANHSCLVEWFTAFNLHNQHFLSSDTLSILSDGAYDLFISGVIRIPSDQDFPTTSVPRGYLPRV